MIAILSHASQIFTEHCRLLKNRLKGKIGQNLRGDQFGFQTGKGARKAILALSDPEE